MWPNCLPACLGTLPERLRGLLGGPLPERPERPDKGAVSARSWSQARSSKELFGYGPKTCLCKVVGGVAHTLACIAAEGGSAATADGEPGEIKKMIAGAKMA